MAELETNVATPTPAPSVQKPLKRKRKKNTVRNIIIAVVVLAALGVGGYFLYGFLTKKETVQSKMQTATAEVSSIQSTVQGSGNAMSKESAAIALTQGGTVEEVLVNVGDRVTAGQPLYTIRSQAAIDAVAAAQEKVDALDKDMNALIRQRSDLTLVAPFSGKLAEVTDLVAGSEVKAGSQVATLVNDKKLRLSLYFSYAYEASIKKGQAVDVSIPSVMRSFLGTVEEINKVHYITPEGADHFEVVISFPNPGTLTEGMAATASLSGADGTAIYPYQNGQTKYYESRQILAKAGGPLVSSNLLKFGNVKEGDVLLVLSADTLDESMRLKQVEIDQAVEKLNEARKGLENFNPMSPIDGTVTSCTLVVGKDVKAGDTVITISNDSAMVVNITVDDRNISFVKPGMMVTLNAYDGNTFQGVVTKIDMSLGGDSMGRGMTNYPVTLEVDNAGGSLLAGMWLDYSFVSSQSDNCVVVPMQSVRYVPDTTTPPEGGGDAAPAPVNPASPSNLMPIGKGGSSGGGGSRAVVFIQAATRPANAIDVEIPEQAPNSPPLYPSQKDGYYAVPVVTGLNDDYNVEIKEGLSGGETVFVNYLIDRASSWG